MKYLSILKPFWVYSIFNYNQAEMSAAFFGGRYNGAIADTVEFEAKG